MHPGPFNISAHYKVWYKPRILIVHAYAAWMITKLDYKLGSHFKGHVVAKNSITTSWCRSLCGFMETCL